MCINEFRTAYLDTIFTRQLMIKVKSISKSEAKQYQLSAYVSRRFKILTLLFSTYVRYLLSTQRIPVFCYCIGIAFKIYPTKKIKFSSVGQIHSTYACNVMFPHLSYRNLGVRKVKCKYILNII